MQNVISRAKKIVKGASDIFSALCIFFGIYCLKRIFQKEALK